MNCDEIGCSTDKAKKLAPKRVSGLVVKTLIDLFELTNLNLISAPLDIPIQFFCINLTLSGQDS